ncbi:MAG TPA: CPBP family intramembrane glutamic endopeptidase [Polyangiaceae bacterium]|nr:CPBP family intramembrane glutamic endopeptidase [Polyangiaceae bacterium]
MKQWLARWTTDQWRTIDAQYRSEALPSWGAAAVLLTAALSLIVAHFYGSARYFSRLGIADGLAARFPYPELHPHLYWSAFKLINYGLLPVLCIKLVLRKRVRDHGLRLVRERGVWWIYLGLLLLVVPVAYVASTTDAFLNTYPKYRGPLASVTELLLWELAYGFQFFMLELFFRGFLIFALARSIGSLSIFVMVVPYAMIHFGKPLSECLGSVVAGIALGTLALRTGSIYGGVLVHCGVAWSMDLFALAHSGALQRLLRTLT